MHNVFIGPGWKVMHHCIIKNSQENQRESSEEFSVMEAQM